jgi:chemotaxis protein CheX
MEVLFIVLTTDKQSQMISHILNGVSISIKNIIPLKLEVSKPQLGQSLEFRFGVLIGIVGDIRGKIVFSGDRNVFGGIGKSMFGMPIEGEMLSSFSGELGNMIAAGLSSNIVEHGIQTDITSPTIMEGHTCLSGFEKAYHILVSCENAGELHIYLLLD